MTKKTFALNKFNSVSNTTSEMSEEFSSQLEPDAVFRLSSEEVVVLK